MYASAMQSRFVVPYTVAFTIVIHVTLVHALSPASGDFNCSAYNPFLSQNMGTNCLSFLDTNPGAFEECRDETKTTTCYIFIEEPPFIIFNKRQFFDASPSAASLQTPFRCGLYASQFETQGGIEGMAFELHNMTSSANDLCMWGGAADYCSFNQLVDYIDIKSRHGYRFGITGLLLEIPQRHCRHEASAAIVDNSMVILSKVEEQDIYRNPIRQLTRPLSWTAWVVVGVTILLLTAVCLTIAIRLHFFRKRSLVTAFFISTGQNDLALQYEEQTGVINEEKAISFATRYSFSMALFRYALIGFFAIFILFYQAAIVNFLFQQEKGMKLKKRFKSLTVDELRTYSVLKDSALEYVWTAAGKYGLCIFNTSVQKA